MHYGASDSEPFKRLTSQTYWDGVSTRRLASSAAVDASHSRGLRSRLRAYCRDHSWRMTERVCRTCLPRTPGLNILEIGCAPGTQLLQLARTLEYEPYGLEYSPAGVEETRRRFKLAGLDPSRVIEGDLFDSTAAKDLGLGLGVAFDIVLSTGLIEHFDDPRAAIRCHLRFLRPGGYLVVRIPNLRGIGWATMRTLRPETIKLHNLDIMRLAAFSDLFADLPLRRIYSGYTGFVHIFGRHASFGTGWRASLAIALDRVQLALNFAMRTGFVGRNVTWPWSPHLLFIGQLTRDWADPVGP